MVEEARRFWMLCRQRPDLNDTEVTLLAIACRHVLANKTVAAGEIGTTDQAMRETVRSWAAEQARLILAGDYEALDRLYHFICSSKLEHGLIGVTAGQIADWRAAQAREWWDKARDGNGWVALCLIEYCEETGAYHTVTGLPVALARAALQQILERYAAGLVQQITISERREWARKALVDLRNFTFLALDVNETARRAGRDQPVETGAWDSFPEERDEFARNETDRCPG